MDTKDQGRSRLIRKLLRKRILNRKRFVAPGIATNWEMFGLREGGHWRDTRWIFPWRSLAEPFHPRSAQEYRAHIESRDSDE